MNRKKIIVMLITAMLVLSVSGCQPDSPPAAPVDDVPSVVTDGLMNVVLKVPQAPYYENLDDFHKNAEPKDSVTDGNTKLKKAAAALTADTAHYELTEFGIAENMLGAEVDIITVEVEKKGKSIYTRTTKEIGEDISQDEFLTIDGQSYRLTDNRTNSIKENPADDIILVTSSMDTITESLSGEGEISVDGETLGYEFYEFGNAQIIAYFSGENFLRADVYLKSSDTFEYKGYFEGSFNLEMDNSLLIKP